jgi:hypothetical protein
MESNGIYRNPGGHNSVAWFLLKNLLVTLLLTGLANGQNPSLDPANNPASCSDLTTLPARSGGTNILPRTSRLKIVKTWPRPGVRAASRYASVGQALAALRKFEQLNVRASQVIVVTDLDRFLDSLSVTDSEARHYWASLQGFVIKGSYPIYLNGKLLPLEVIDDLLRQQGPVPAVYGLAGIIVHEYWHIQGWDENVVSQKELALLARFKDAGLLGPDAQATRYIAAVRQQCDELQAHPETLIERIKIFSILAPTIQR